MKLKRSRKGFSLTELLVASAIAGVLAYAIFAGMMVSSRQVRLTEAKMNLQSIAREALFRMTEELRQAQASTLGLDAANDEITYTPPDSTTPVNADGSMNWSGTAIKFTLGGLNGKQLLMKDGATTTVLANDVTGFDFVKTGSSIVDITISLQRTFGGQNFPEQPIVMTARAELRNA